MTRIENLHLIPIFSRKTKMFNEKFNHYFINQICETKIYFPPRNSRTIVILVRNITNEVVLL